MFAQFILHFPEDKKMLAVKSTSIIFSDNKNYVLRYRSKCDVTIQPVNIFKSSDGISFIEGESLREGDLAIARNGLYVFTELEKL
jgi:cobalt-zinc-cadmium efflux system membrane fusion protein